MDATTAGWLVLLLGFVAANLPFLSERVLLLGPRPAHKAFYWRLIELLLLGALTVGLGMVVEGQIGQRAPQTWAFYAVVLCLMLTFAFPGFVWRHLRHGTRGG